MPMLWVASGEAVEVDEEDRLEFGWRNLHLTTGYPSFYIIKPKGEPRCKVMLHTEIYKLINPLYTGILDHEDRNRLNCKRNNLREATYSQNCCNQEIRKDNTSGYKGIHWNNRSSKWVVRIQVKGSRIHLGSFESYIEAVEVRRLAALTYHNIFAGEF